VGIPDIHPGRRLRALLAAAALALPPAAAAEPPAAAVVPPDLVSGVPADFPRFAFAGHDEAAAILNRYLWHHFSTRGGESPVLFNKEYTTTSDLWMAGALHPGWDAPIQTIHRRNLLAVHIDRDGYIATHQHFSHAHERGWPFPYWAQTPPRLTAGWHFQDDGPGWVWEYTFRKIPVSNFARAKAIEGWELRDLRSDGIVDSKWRLTATGRAPALTTPADIPIDAACAPFVQIRWKRSGKTPGGPRFLWMREGDAGFAADRSAEFDPDSGEPGYEGVSKTEHMMAALWRHPLWRGTIVRMRIEFPPGDPGEAFDVDSFFTVYDTRHTINNPIFILACWSQFRWTGDVEFLRATIDRMRRALRFQQTELGGVKLNRIRNPWWGHSGRPGYLVLPDNKKQIQPQHGIGSNYWDILPFGGDDLYATNQYYASLLAMAEVEEAARRRPDWKLPREGALDPAALRKHAAAVKTEANRLFWDAAKGRFVGCIDDTGAAHEYGFTFLNLDAIWYGLASDEHARAILDWLSGKRIVEGDTSTGADIYHWRFGPRATTLRNLEWYNFGWTAPESLPWGGQVQDGGAVLGFTFYDLWARLNHAGPDDAWTRLAEILAWEKEVWAEGGYRKYYDGGKRGTTLQGGGTAGGLGIDHEFYESSLLPAIVVLGFLGLDPGADRLVLRPRLPAACPEMAVTGVLYRGARMNVRAGPRGVKLTVKDAPKEPLHVAIDIGASGGAGKTFTITAAGEWEFRH
jgi:hypothetical protein